MTTCILIESTRANAINVRATGDELEVEARAYLQAEIAEAIASFANKCVRSSTFETMKAAIESRIAKAERLGLIEKGSVVVEVQSSILDRLLDFSGRST